MKNYYGKNDFKSEEEEMSVLEIVKNIIVLLITSAIIFYGTYSTIGVIKSLLGEIEPLEKMFEMMQYPTIALGVLYLTILVEQIILLIYKLSHKEGAYVDSTLYKILKISTYCMSKLVSITVSVVCILLAIGLYYLFEAPLSFCVILGICCILIILGALLKVFARIKIEFEK